MMPMGRRLMAVFLVVALAGLGWLWREGERPAAPGVSAGEASLTRVAAAPAELPSPELAAPELTASELVRDAPAPDSTRRESAAPERERAAPDADGQDADSSDDVRIRVVDPAGKPCAGLSLRLDRGANDTGEAPGPKVTDAEGRVRFAAMRGVLARAAEAWTLRHELPAAELPRLVLDAVTLARPEIVWVLPWGGALEIVVRELGGAPAPEGCSLRLKLVRAEDLANPVLTGPDWKPELQDGKALFPWVELGRSWELSAWRAGGNVPTSTRVPGPTTAEERVRVELVLGADHPLVSFRLVDAEGQHLPYRKVELARRQMFGFVDSTSVVTDAQGRFTADGQADGGAFVVSHQTPAGLTLRGRASLPEALEDGMNDGGDVVLADAPVLCAGRVVDELGRPFAGADVVAGEENRHGFGGSDATRGKSDEQGRFELHGLQIRDDFELRAEAPGQRSETIRARQGNTGIELVLRAHHTLSGRLLVDPGIDPGAIRFQLQAPGAEWVHANRRQRSFGFRRLAHGPGPPAQDAADDDPARFVLEAIRPGEYELRCLLEDVELARVGKVSVHENVDVGSIDLRGRVHVCEIAFLGAAGSEKLSGELEWKPHGSDERHRGRIDGDLARILTPTVPIDVALWPRGYREVRLEELSGRREAVLEPPLRVRIVLRTDGELPELPYLLGCDLYLGDARVGEPRGMRYFTAENREIEFLASSAGALRVRWNLERRVDGASFGGARGSHVLAEHEAEIEVLDAAAEQVFPVALDGGALTGLARDPPW
jgi:carboxypeptidase family protein